MAARNPQSELAAAADGSAAAASSHGGAVRDTRRAWELDEKAPGKGDDAWPATTTDGESGWVVLAWLDLT